LHIEIEHLATHCALLLGKDEVPIWVYNTLTLEVALILKWQMCNPQAHLYKMFSKLEVVQKTKYLGLNLWN
jgi:hypothetical protein